MKSIRSFSYFFMVLIVSGAFTACKTNDPNNPSTSTTIKDIDGNTYQTVTIGTQVWMVENLKTTKYKDGTTIPVVTDNTAWSKLTTGAYCNYNNDAAMGTKYGKLYNWYAVNTGKLAPSGWHIPTDAEWTTLENFVSANLGSSGSLAKALAATTDWAASTNIGAIGNDLTKNNSSGFSAIPGGDRIGDGAFDIIGNYGSWWTSTDGNYTYAWYRGLINGINYLRRFDTTKSYGFSVRCIRDPQ
jgi:uncharacterized protein (TIGR02145 family)